MSPYRKLEAIFARLNALGEAAGMLHWDMSVMMPPGGAEARAEQLAALHVTRHEMLTDRRTGGLLDEAEADTGEDAGDAGEDEAAAPWRRANLGEMRRRHTHAGAVDGALVAALTKASTACEMIWREARPANDFARVVPSLEALLALVREAADAKAGVLGCAPYEALMDEHELGARSDWIDAIFDDLAEFLPGFLDDVLARQAAAPPPMQPEGPFPVAAQRKLATGFMTRLGFDFNHGRLDVSLHPFCGGVPEDVRITTRYGEDDFTQSLMGVLHETGHALYEMGLPEQWRRQPVGHARGMAIHESQSLLIEMQTCRSRGFIEFAAPLMRDAFDGSGPAWDADNLYRLYTRVARGLIRVDADEVTYPAHVILRYRLERAMIAGDLPLAELPAAWNEAMESLLGNVPPDDGSGCLQDIHWYDGAFGYFPTYTLGAIAAAQLFEAAKGCDPDIEPGIARGDFVPLMGWLGENVHSKASLFGTDELMRQATGAPLGTESFKRHLKARYLS
jgi:carboxypeptidase Taq